MYNPGELGGASVTMKETPADKFLRYLNDEIEKGLLATPSANRGIVMKMVRLMKKEIQQAIHWGVRQESTPFPSNPFNASRSELELVAHALAQARARQASDTQ